MKKKLGIITLSLFVLVLGIFATLDPGMAFSQSQEKKPAQQPSPAKPAAQDEEPVAVTERSKAPVPISSPVLG